MVTISIFNKDNGCVEDILNNDKSFGDVVDTPNQGTELHKNEKN